MPSRTVVVPNAAPVLVPLSGKLNGALIKNTSIVTGATITVMDEGQNIIYVVDPGETLVIEPSDTAFRADAGKINTSCLYLAGQAVASVTVRMFWSTKYTEFQSQFGQQGRITEV